MLLIIYVLLIVNEMFLIEGSIVEYDLIVRSIPSNPDGYPRSVIIIHHKNSSWDPIRPIPGPLIRAKLGDILRIRITNHLNDQSTSIHFHGLHMYENPWSDGTEYITQCPIAPHQTFLYEFRVTQTGTFWYHSHNAQQYADGLVGPILIDNDSIERKYSYGLNDYIIMLQEWYHENWNDIITGYQGPYDSYPGNIPFYPWPPTSFLINGHGNFNCKLDDCSLMNRTWKDPCGIETPVQCIPLRSPLFGPCRVNIHPIDQFYCPLNKQIRIRLINAASGIPFRFSIDKHSLTIVARDSLEIIPINVTYVHIPIGQRLDLIINCNEDPSLNYRILVASRNSFHPVDIITGPTPTMWTEAILTYNQQSKNEDHYRSLNNPPIILNDPEDPFFEYKSLKPIIPSFSPPAMKRISLSFSVHWNNRSGIDALEEWAVNNITFLPPKIPLLEGIYFDHSFDDIIGDQYQGIVQNIHATNIYHLEHNQIYEILLINDDPQQHPWHVHGYTLQFIAAGKLPHIPILSCNQTQQQFKEIELHSILPLTNETVPILSLGDSFNIPRQSYVLFRFKADNIGPWFVHCHMDWHISPGMAFVFSVEHNHTYKPFIQPPPHHFPLCGFKFTSLDSTTINSSLDSTTINSSLDSTTINSSLDSTTINSSNAIQLRANLFVVYLFIHFIQIF